MRDFEDGGVEVKPKAFIPIVADPLALDRAGVCTARQMAIFIHVGRCGLCGVTIPQMTAGLRVCGSTVTSVVNGLLELGLVTSAGRSNAKGRTITYVVTVKGWGVLTAPADFSMFSQVQGELKMKKDTGRIPVPREEDTGRMPVPQEERGVA